MLGQYRAGSAADPDIYVAGVAAILAEYPPETMRYVTDPRTGLAANPIKDPDTGRAWKGLPDLADVKTACEMHYGPVRRAQQREVALQRQIAEAKAERAREEVRASRPSYEDLQRRCAEAGLFIGGANRTSTPFGIESFREKFGVSEADWNAIPNRPERT